MDRLAAHVIATAALTVTLATVPVLFADASHAATRSAPAPAAAANPSSWQAADARTGTTAGPAEPPLAAETEAAAAEPAAAAPTARTDRTYTLPQAARPCADLRQVGRTTHARFHGVIAFSVRQYYSATCRSYFGYSFAWQRFRKLNVRYDVGTAVFDRTRDTIEGARSYIGGAGGPAYWSAPVPAVKGACTQGEGHFFYYPANARYGFEEGDTLSPKVCAEV